jgi:hypothetical protein
MSRPLRPGDPPPDAGGHRASELIAAAACEDCTSELWFVPVALINGSPAFSCFVAHDETCPAMAQARIENEREP